MNSIMGIVLALGLFLAGCATSPPAVREAPPGDLQLAEARDNISAHRDTTVRWGGVIMSVDNKDNETWIEVLELKLSRSGEPKRYSRSDGRFLIRVERFLDPAIYVKGRKITVVGTLADEVEKSIGEHPYSFPVVSADEYHLWPPAYYYSYYPHYYYGYYPRYYYGYRYGHGPRYHHGFYFGHHHHHGFHLRFHY